MRHTPATPLPWSHEIGTNANVLKRSEREQQQIEPAQDVAYIVTACNAYPRLVERVNRVAHWQPSVDDERLAVSALDREIYEARTLLREIGEDA